MNDIDSLFGNGKKVLIDVKGIFDRSSYESAGYTYWRL
jgi:UDP-N-acetyl-D-galactosamine dehydrogenase